MTKKTLGTKKSGQPAPGVQDIEVFCHESDGLKKSLAVLEKNSRPLGTAVAHARPELPVTAFTAKSQRTVQWTFDQEKFSIPKTVAVNLLNDSIAQIGRAMNCYTAAKTLYLQLEDGSCRFSALTREERNSMKRSFQLNFVMSLDALYTNITKLSDYCLANAINLAQSDAPLADQQLAMALQLCRNAAELGRFVETVSTANKAEISPASYTINAITGLFNMLMQCLRACSTSDAAGLIIDRYHDEFYALAKIAFSKQTVHTENCTLVETCCEIFTLTNHPDVAVEFMTKFVSEFLSKKEQTTFDQIATLQASMKLINSLSTHLQTTQPFNELRLRKKMANLVTSSNLLITRVTASTAAEHKYFNDQFDENKRQKFAEFPDESVVYANASAHLGISQDTIRQFWDRAHAIQFESLCKTPDLADSSQPCLRLYQIHAAIEERKKAINGLSEIGVIKPGTDTYRKIYTAALHLTNLAQPSLDAVTAQLRERIDANSGKIKAIEEQIDLQTAEVDKYITQISQDLTKSEKMSASLQVQATKKKGSKPSAPAKPAPAPSVEQESPLTVAPLLSPLDYSLRSARHLWSRSCFEEAAQHYEKALTLITDASDKLKISEIYFSYAALTISSARDAFVALEKMSDRIHYVIQHYRLTSVELPDTAGLDPTIARKITMADIYVDKRLDFILPAIEKGNKSCEKATRLLRTALQTLTEHHLAQSSETTTAVAIAQDILREYAESVQKMSRIAREFPTLIREWSYRHKDMLKRIGQYGQGTSGTWWKKHPKTLLIEKIMDLSAQHADRLITTSHFANDYQSMLITLGLGNKKTTKPAAEPAPLTLPADEDAFMAMIDTIGTAKHCDAALQHFNEVATVLATQLPPTDELYSRIQAWLQAAGERTPTPNAAAVPLKNIAGYYWNAAIRQLLTVTRQWVASEGADNMTAAQLNLVEQAAALLFVRIKAIQREDNATDLNTLQRLYQQLTQTIASTHAHYDLYLYGSFAKDLVMDSLFLQNTSNIKTDADLLILLEQADVASVMRLTTNLEALFTNTSNRFELQRCFPGAPHQNYLMSYRLVFESIPFDITIRHKQLTDLNRESIDSYKGFYINLRNEFRVVCRAEYLWLLLAGERSFDSASFKDPSKFAYVLKELATMDTLCIQLSKQTDMALAEFFDATEHQSMIAMAITLFITKYCRSLEHDCFTFLLSKELLTTLEPFKTLLAQQSQTDTLVNETRHVLTMLPPNVPRENLFPTALLLAAFRLLASVHQRTLQEEIRVGLPTSSFPWSIKNWVSVSAEHSLQYGLFRPTAPNAEAVAGPAPTPSA